MPTLISDTWQIHLLGSPSASRGERKLSLRTRESWGVLASLLLPPRLDLNAFSRTSYPKYCPRGELAERFWGEKVEARVHLRQALSFLKATFGEECFQITRDTAGVMPGRFLTDIEQILILYRDALRAESLEEKIFILSRVETWMRGELLAGYTPPLATNALWIQNRRSEMRGIFVAVLLDLVKFLQNDGQEHAALSVAARALEIDPDGKEAQNWVWDLSQKTGQSFVHAAIETENDFTMANALLERTVRGKGKTLSDQHRFQELFERELLASVRPDWQQAYVALSIFPAPFTAELAKEVCQAPRKLLNTLTKTSLLRRVEEKYVVPEPVKIVAWRRILPAVKQRLMKRLSLLCENWVLNLYEPSGQPHNELLFTGSDTDLIPYLRLMLHWSTNQVPTVERLDTIGYLYRFGMIEEVFQTLSYLVETYEHEANSASVRWHAGIQAGHIYKEKGDFASAVRWYERTLSLSSELPDVDIAAYKDATLRSCLGLAHHYSGDSRRAIVELSFVQDYFGRKEAFLELAAILRQTCEIQCNLGLFEDALASSSKAVELRRSIPATRKAIADALFWKGSTLFRLKKVKEAIGVIEEALSIWQEEEEWIGMGHCLRVYGAICAEEGRFTEAKAHLAHAILLHEKAGSSGCLYAAVQVLANVRARERISLQLSL